MNPAPMMRYPLSPSSPCPQFVILVLVTGINRGTVPEPIP